MGKTAFAAQRSTVFNFDPDELVLVEDPAHPLYQERVKLPVSDALVCSMMVRGFRSTIRVRRDGDRAEVVDGRQRVKAAREANRRLKAEGKQPIKVQAYLEHGDDADLFGVMVLSNHGEQRDDPMSEARELQRFLSMGRSHEEAAAIFCRPVSWVKQSLTLFDLAPRVQDAVTHNRVSVSAAAKLARFGREDQVKKLDHLLSATSPGKRATVEQVKRAVREDSGEVHVSSPSKKEIRRALFIANTVGGPQHLKLTIGDALRWVCTGAGPFGEWLAKRAGAGEKAVG